MHIKEKSISNDSTIKYFLTSSDCGELSIECCLLNLKKHGNIICISSQLGCPHSCSFCAAGSKNFIRSLTSNEIIDQVNLITQDQPHVLKTKFQITYMGCGEPLSNIGAVVDSIQQFFDRYNTLEKINISTILPSLDFPYKLFEPFRNRIHFQFSLHFANNMLRKKYFRNSLPLIEQSLQYLDGLAETLNDYYAINYILIYNINDSSDSAIELSDLVKPHMNNGYLKISELCEIEESKLKPSSNINEFISIIESKQIHYDLFRSNGIDVCAGCGQFYNLSIL